MRVKMKKERGDAKEVELGFSWTTLFFGSIPALWRSDWKWFVIQTIALGMTLGVSTVLFAFLYNKLYANELLQDGYKPVTNADREMLVNEGLLSVWDEGVKFF